MSKHRTHSYVYLIQAMETWRLKIGRASSPERRLATLQTGSPEPLVLVAAIPTIHSGHLESELHRRFADFRIHGEWFRNAPEITRYFSRRQEGKNF